MSTVVMKPYSVERRRGVTGRGTPPCDGAEAWDAEGPATLEQVLEAIRVIDAKLSNGTAVAAVEDGGGAALDLLPGVETEPGTVKDQSRQIEMIQTEIAEISGRIRTTKAEIAALRHPLATEDKFGMASETLGQIIDQTEHATGQIMDSGEKIEEIARELQSHTEDEYVNGRLGEISDTVTRVYEACNFQDLTGQRITKVIKVLDFIEQRVDAMVATWDIKELESMPLPEGIDRVDGDVVLTGPVMDGTEGTYSQDDIDALFD